MTDNFTKNCIEDYIIEITKSSSTTKDNKKCNCYGIFASNNSSFIRVDNISCDLKFVEQLSKLLKEKQVSILHIKDVIEDQLVEKYG